MQDGRNEHFTVFVYANRSVMYLLRTRKGDKVVPLTFKILASYYDIHDREFVRFVDVLLSSLDFGFAKDIRLYLERGLFLPNLSVNECFGYHSLGDVLADKYAIKGNWHKCDVNLLYVCHKVSRFANDASKALLAEFRDDTFLYRAGFYDDKVSFQSKRSVGVEKFVYQWYLDRIGPYDIANDLISDYLQTCHLLKEKINLRFHSWRKLEEEHQRLSSVYRMRYMPDVMVPKHSVFEPLLNRFPESFIWIRTKRRLCQESVEMHNCVSDYAVMINQDKCAIYSAVVCGERCTIEVIVDGGHYVLAQMYGVCNRVCSDDALAYVRSLLPKEVCLLRN